jgi:hypothetical protein
MKTYNWSFCNWIHCSSSQPFSFHKHCRGNSSKVHTVYVYLPLQMKGRWESNINGWFIFIYSQKWNCYFQNRSKKSLPVPTLIYISVRDLYISRISLPILLQEYVDRSWEYINRSQTHECGNWDWGRAIPRKGTHKWDCPYSFLYAVKEAQLTVK